MRQKQTLLMMVAIMVAAAACGKKAILRPPSSDRAAVEAVDPQEEDILDLEEDLFEPVDIDDAFAEPDRPR